MGASNVAQVFTHWAPRLTHREAVALAYMALISLDAGEPAVYWGGWEAIARVLGLDPDSNASSSRRQVTKVLTALSASGVVVSSGAAKKGVRAEYALALDPGTSWKVASVEGRKIRWERTDVGPKRSQVDPGSWDQSGPPTWDQNGPTGWDQNGPQVGTETVPPKRTEEPLDENSYEQLPPQATVSPAGELATIENEIVLDDPEVNAQALMDHFVAQLAQLGIKPQSTAGWKRAAAALLNQDSPENIGAVIQYALTDHFWASRAHTLPKIAQHYNTLKIQSKTNSVSKRTWDAQKTVAAFDAAVKASFGTPRPGFDPWEHTGPHDDHWGKKPAKQATCNECLKSVDESLLHRVKNGPTGRVCEACIASNRWEAA